MKNLLILIAVLIGVNTCYAQTKQTSITMGAMTAAGVNKARDTTANVDTTYLTFKSSGVYNYHFKATVTKISGTVGGSAILQGSPDNSRWYTLNNAVSGIDSNAYVYANTATLTNATNTYDWFYGGTSVFNFPYFRIRFIMSGTQSSVPTGIVDLHPTVNPLLR